MQRKGQPLMCTVTDMPMLAIRMDTRKHMTMVIVMVGMRIITVMQKKSQLLMFIVTDMVTHMDMVIHTDMVIHMDMVILTVMVIHTAVVIPTVTIMVGTRMGILTVTLTTALKESYHSQNNLTWKQKKKSFLKRFQLCKERPTNTTKI